MSERETESIPYHSMVRSGAAINASNVTGMQKQVFHVVGLGPAWHLVGLCRTIDGRPNRPTGWAEPYREPQRRRRKKAGRLLVTIAQGVRRKKIRRGKEEGRRATGAAVTVVAKKKREGEADGLRWPQDGNCHTDGPGGKEEEEAGREPSHRRPAAAEKKRSGKDLSFFS